MKLNRIFPEATDDITRASTCSAMLRLRVGVLVLNPSQAKRRRPQASPGY